jgi:3alpha(or 20beta)-hydroxysteroid dehydrogenase
MAKTLAGKVALLTGGARGMGESHARAIVAHGGKVVIGDVLDAPGQALADELGSEVTAYVHLDVTSKSDWAAAVAKTIELFGALNVLVNNAGISGFEELGTDTHAVWDRHLAINLTGPYLGIQAALDALRRSAPSSIINVGSASAFQGQAGLHAYTASKWGVRGLTKSAAVELAASNIRVNAVHPGVIRTPMTEGLDLTGQFGPLGRAGEPAEVSHMIVYLASDASSFSTGADFLVDGGTLAGPVNSLHADS